MARIGHACVSSLVLLALVTAWAHLPAASAGGQVVVLTDDNFDDYTSTGAWILEFYAPWCTHCKRLAPILDEVAAESPDSVRVGKVDCTEHKALQDRHNVKGYPTLFFKRDNETRIYRGGREKDDLLGFVTVVTSPPVKEANKSNFKKLSASTPVNFVFSGFDMGPEFDAFQRAARTFQGVVGFFRSTDPTLLQSVGLSEQRPGIAAVSEGNDNEIYKGLYTPAAVKEWVKINQLPLVSELSGENFSELVESAKLAVFAVTNPAKSYSKQYLEMFTKVAKTYREKFNFANVDGAKYQQYISQFDLDLDHGPTAFVLDYPNEMYFTTVGTEYDAGSDKSLRRFLDAVFQGELSARTVGPWWAPGRFLRWFEKWMSQFTDVQLMIGSGVVALAMIGMIFFICCGDSEPVPPVPASSKDDDNKSAKASRKDKKTPTPKIVEEDSSDDDADHAKKD